MNIDDIEKIINKFTVFSKCTIVYNELFTKSYIQFNNCVKLVEFN